MYPFLHGDPFSRCRRANFETLLSSIPHTPHKLTPRQPLCISSLSCFCRCGRNEREKVIRDTSELWYYYRDPRLAGVNRPVHPVLQLVPPRHYSVLETRHTVIDAVGTRHSLVARGSERLPSQEHSQRAVVAQDTSLLQERSSSSSSNMPEVSVNVRCSNGEKFTTEVRLGTPLRA